MKKLTVMLLGIALTGGFLASCEKEDNEDDNSADCYTCRALYNNGTTVQKELCTDADKRAFRNQNAGAEIDCP